MSCHACVSYLDTNLLVHTILLFFDLLVQFFEGCCIWGSSVCLQYLNISAMFVRLALPDKLYGHLLIG
jgi:hypothetical protein